MYRTRSGPDALNLDHPLAIGPRHSENDVRGTTHCLSVEKSPDRVPFIRPRMLVCDDDGTRDILPMMEPHTFEPKLVGVNNVYPLAPDKCNEWPPRGKTRARGAVEAQHLHAGGGSVRRRYGRLPVASRIKVLSKRSGSSRIAIVRATRSPPPSCTGRSTRVSTRSGLTITDSLGRCPDLPFTTERHTRSLPSRTSSHPRAPILNHGRTRRAIELRGEMMRNSPFCVYARAWALTEPAYCLEAAGHQGELGTRCEHDIASRSVIWSRW